MLVCFQAPQESMEFQRNARNDGNRRGLYEMINTVALDLSREPEPKATTVEGPVKWLSYIAIINDALHEITKSDRQTPTYSLHSPFYDHSNSPVYYFSKYFSRQSLG